MKKKIYLLLMLVVAISLLSCNKEVKKNDLTKNDLKGNVKYIEEKTYSVIEKFGEAQKDKLEDYTFISFNKGGNFVNFITNDRKTIYKYDSKGNNIEELNFLGGRNTYKYDSKGNIIEGSYYDSNGILNGKYIYKYDSKGNKIEKNSYDSKGNLDGKYIYKYDSEGNKIEESYYYSNGNLASKNTYKYDSKGNMIEKSDYDSNGIFEGKQVSKYDSEGNLIEHIEDVARNFNNEVIIKYKNTYKYDSEGNMIEENNYQSILNSEWKFKFKILKTYDSKGNWIKMIIKDENGKAIKITERKIVYYGDDDENNYPEWDSPSYKGINIQNESVIDVSTETQTETPLQTSVLTENQTLTTVKKTTKAKAEPKTKEPEVDPCEAKVADYESYSLRISNAFKNRGNGAAAVKEYAALKREAAANEAAVNECAENPNYKSIVAQAIAQVKRVL